MFGFGAVFLVAAATMAGMFGLATSLADALARFVPGMTYGTPRWLGQMGGTDVWQRVAQPVMEMPCLAPFLVLGAVFILFGILRRL